MQLTLSQFSPCADGITPDTTCFQRALDLLAERGGGTLTVGAGRYRVGGLRLHSHCRLHLASGALLIISDDYHDFCPVQSRAECSDRAFLYAAGASDIAVTGDGKICGNSASWFAASADEMGYRQPAAQRPRIIVMEGCQQVRLMDFTIEDAPMWTIHLVACQQIKVQRVTVRNDLCLANTDALDIDCCQQVQISDCDFSAADDGICLKTARHTPALQQPASQIVINNCLIRSKSCAIKIGTETAFDIEDVTVSNCVIYQSNRGIGLVSRDGGNLRRMIFSNIVFDCHTAHPCHWGKADPLYISVRYRDPAIEPGDVAMIQFRGLTGCAEGAVNFHSEPYGKIHHILVSDVQLRQTFSQSAEQGFYDIRPPCNPASPVGSGKDNAWARDPLTQHIWGVEPYPAGLPALYARGVVALRVRFCDFLRPQPLPDGWCPQHLWLDACEGVTVDE
ncbi:glycoside hydrolase family 28 protein [Enterobacter sp.]|uniref:glycoside hydrolase family 28 protein n=1 Tax=Enterobacter sp. TaxID=42895 RepID=UPI00296FDFA3|nr:glycosyl hydrolase family 28 protein [Enterobacter sp.]